MSQNAPETPLVTTTVADEAETLFIPNADVNFADDEDAKAWVQENLVRIVLLAESTGVQQREEWQRIRDMVYMKHGADQAYLGESNAYLPTYAKASDVRTSHINRALFPTDSVVDVVAEDDKAGDPEALKCWMQYQLEVEAKFRVNMKKHVRTLNDFGFAVSKVYWHKPPAPDKQVKLRKMALGSYGTLGAENCEGARFMPRDIFAFYIWPTSIDSLDQASLVYEVMQVSKQDADLRFKSGLWKNQTECGFPERTGYVVTPIQQLAEGVTGSPDTAVTSTSGGELGTWGLVKECWLRMPIPKALYGPAELPGTPVPVKVVLINGMPVEITRNPFWHQKPPYVAGGLGVRPNQIYGTGLGKMGLQIQSLINDTMNQTQDNVTYGLNPMAVLNPTQLVGTSNVTIKPGGVINTLDPNAVKFDRPPIEQVQYGMSQATTLVGWMNDLLGTPPIIQGSGSKGSAKTATGSQILQNNVKTDMQDVVEDLELTILVPTMEMVYSLGEQYEKAERWLALTGQQPVKFTREAFLGKYKFRWLASSQTENRQVRAQQGLQFLAQIVNPGILQLLMQQGKMINPEPLLKLIYSTAVGGRDFDKIIMQAPMMPGMPPGMPGQPPQLPPGAEPDRARSAVEQAEGGSGEVAPGEAEDFMNVRSEADDMAAMLGGAGGYGE